MLKTIENQAIQVKLQIRIQNVEKKSTIYYGIDVSANITQIVTEDTNEITETMQISTTQVIFEIEVDDMVYNYNIILKNFIQLILTSFCLAFYRHRIQHFIWIISHS